MADIVSSPLSDGNGVADEGGRDSVISRQPGVPPDEGFFGRRPRPPEVLTGLPPTVREATAALLAAVGSIDDSRGG
jgi:hypothetical protein